MRRCPSRPKCSNRHVLPLLDLFCQTKKGGERCNANFKLQWSYGTMVKRCEMQKNRDHDLWWVRYKNEWKQRRTIIRYKKDFLTHLSDVQRTLLLGLGMEGEAPPDPKVALGPTYDALLATAGTSPGGKKHSMKRFSCPNSSYFFGTGHEESSYFAFNSLSKRHRDGYMSRQSLPPSAHPFFGAAFYGEDVNGPPHQQMHLDHYQMHAASYVIPSLAGAGGAAVGQPHQNMYSGGSYELGDGMGAVSDEEAKSHAPPVTIGGEEVAAQE
eukprot:Polyplicarium_translucidae@DN2833_c0_g1_i1.p1